MRIHDQLHVTVNTQPHVVLDVDGLVTPHPHVTSLLHHLGLHHLHHVKDNDLWYPKLLTHCEAHMEPVSHVEIRSSG